MDRTLEAREINSLLLRAADTIVAESCDQNNVTAPLTVQHPEQRLSDKHLVMLRGDSAITDEVILARGYRTVSDRHELQALGFATSQARVPGLLLPLHAPDGRVPFHVYRPDNPRVAEDRRKKPLADGSYESKVIKYEVPNGESTRIDCPPTCRPQLANPAIPLWITEGQKKADSLASRGFCAVALLGVWNWKGRNEWGGKTVLADFDLIALNGREVRIVFDSDVMTKSQVREALERFTAMLHNKGAHVQHVYLPPGPSGKVGVDDWFAEGHEAEELEALVEVLRAAPKAAPPRIEILDEASPVLRRPLSLIGDTAYAATWLTARITRSESVDKSTGKIVYHNPPLVHEEQRLFLVWDGGSTMLDQEQDTPLELDFAVHLPEIPRTDRCWSGSAVKRYSAGQRPCPLDVFQRIHDIVNYYIDFDHSLASQQVMAEMIGCYVLATWFLDAFNVIGYLWPNGTRGSGKTQLLTVVTSLGYLGELILAGGSYASLRDLADYGATLAFDDAENLASSHGVDGDKRALLLAGNRRGATVPVKEPTATKNWRTRHVNTFCPRLFSAINLPEPVLESRSIVVPLVRTPDRARANRDPIAYQRWPHERRQLIDDLWALAVTHLPRMKEYDQALEDHPTLLGRNLEPWRAILAVARWLEDQGVVDLGTRMEQLAQRYIEQERHHLHSGDLTTILLRSLCRCVSEAIKHDVSDVSDISRLRGHTWKFPTAQISKVAQRLITDEEIDIDPGCANSRSIGSLMGTLRFQKMQQGGGLGRGWRVSLDELERCALTYGLDLYEELGIPKSPSGSPPLLLDVTDVTNVTSREIFEL